MTTINMQERTPETLDERLKAALSVAQQQPGANVEQLGIWIWVQFDTKPNGDIRRTLKENGFR